MSRKNTSTVKVKTDFGSFFVHVESNDIVSGATGVWVSMQQKLENTQVDKLVNQIIEGVHEGIDALSVDQS
jgi:hydrogenase maturation factor